MVPPGSSAHGFSCSRRLSPLSGRNSTYRPVQISATGSNIGLAVPHIEIYYPLSHEIVLAYMCPLTMREMEEKLRSSEIEVNSLFSRKFMSPKGLSVADRLEIERSRGKFREQRTTMR